MSDFGCILWPETHVKENGYGWVVVGGKTEYAHRWVMRAGPDDVVDHACHNRAARDGECDGGDSCQHRRCVNPGHLIFTDQGSNLRATPHGNVAKRFRTHCSKGHEFSTENTIWESRREKGKMYSRRRCRTCRQQQQRDAHATRKERARA
jgi:hypothetical protein